MFPKNARSGASLAAALALFCCAALCARASEKTDVSLALLVEQDYDSNVLLLHDDPIGSAVTIVRPSIGYREHRHARLGPPEGWLSSHTFWERDEAERSRPRLERRLRPHAAAAPGAVRERQLPARRARTPRFARRNVVTISGGARAHRARPSSRRDRSSPASVPNVDLGQGEFGARVLAHAPEQAVAERRSVLGRLPRRARSANWSSAIRTAGSGATLHVDDAATRPRPLERRHCRELDQPGDVTTRRRIDTGKSISDQQSLSLGWNRTWNELWTTSGSIGVRRLHTQTLGASRPVTHVAPAPALPGGVQPVVEFIPTDFEDTGPGLIGSMVVRARAAARHCEPELLARDSHDRQPHGLRRERRHAARLLRPPPVGARHLHADRQLPALHLGQRHPPDQAGVLRAGLVQPDHGRRLRVQPRARSSSSARGRAGAPSATFPATAG